MPIIDTAIAWPTHLSFYSTDPDRFRRMPYGAASIRNAGRVLLPAGPNRQLDLASRLDIVHLENRRLPAAFAIKLAGRRR